MLANQTKNNLPREAVTEVEVCVRNRVWISGEHDGNGREQAAAGRSNDTNGEQSKNEQGEHRKTTKATSTEDIKLKHREEERKMKIGVGLYVSAGSEGAFQMQIDATHGKGPDEEGMTTH